MAGTFASSSTSYDAPDFFAPRGVPVVRYTKHGWRTRVKGVDEDHELRFDEDRSKKNELDGLLFDSSCSLYGGAAAEVVPRKKLWQWDLITNQLKEMSSPVSKSAVCFRHSSEHRTAQGFHSSQRHAPDNCESLRKEKATRLNVHRLAMEHNPVVFAKRADYGTGAHELDAHVLARSFLCDTHKIKSKKDLGPLKHTWPANNRYGPYQEPVRSLTPGPGRYQVHDLSITKNRSNLGWGKGHVRTMPNLNLWGSTQRGKTWHEKQVINKTLKKDRRMRLDWCEQIKGEQNAEASSSMQQIRHFEKLNLAHGSSHAGGSGGAS